MPVPLDLMLSQTLSGSRHEGRSCSIRHRDCRRGADQVCLAGPSPERETCACAVPHIKLTVSLDPAMSLT